VFRFLIRFLDDDVDLSTNMKTAGCVM